MQTNLKHLRDTIIDRYEFENSKHDPEVFLLVAKKFGVAPADSVVVEDPATGIEPVRLSGMKSRAIGIQERITNADRVVLNLSSLSVDCLSNL